MLLSAHRPLIKTLVFSLLVHAVVLVSLRDMQPLRLDVSAAVMRVVIGHEKRAELEAPAKAALDSPAMKPSSTPAPQSVARRVIRRQVVSAEAQPVLVPATPAPPSVSDAEVSRPVALSAQEAPGVASGEQAAVRESVNADDLRQYRVSLASAARRFKRYPALAREQGWTGSVEVAIRFGSLRPAPDVVLLRSSGRPLLDEQALEMMAQAVRATTPPVGLAGLDFQISLPVKFSLDEGQ